MTTQNFWTGMIITV